MLRSIPSELLQVSVERLFPLEALKIYLYFGFNMMIKDSHKHEWITLSGIDPKLTQLAIISLENYTPHEYLLYALTCQHRRNDGTLRKYWIERFNHLVHGGWFCFTVNVFTGEIDEWGCFKPDVPYVKVEQPNGFDPNSTAKQKIYKYEHPPKTPTKIFALPIPLHLWQAIAEFYDIPLPDNIEVTIDGRALGFWQWVIANPKIPLIITEGAKKAACLITNAFVSIALPGIYGGYRQERDNFNKKVGKPKLIPELEVFTHPDREIIFAFDNDNKPKTIANVWNAIQTTGALFKKKSCKVSVISWNTTEKGVDDLILAKGIDFFQTLYNNRKSLSDFNIFTLLDLSAYDPIQVNEPYVTDENNPDPLIQLLALKSAKNTGKTQWISRQVYQAIRDGKPIIVLTHRKQLGRGLAYRFGLDYRTDIETSIYEGKLGYALCIHSLHPYANPPFNPDDWREAVVIIDEVEQVLWEMLNSNTCQNMRIPIIQTLKQLLQTVVGTGGKIIVADADLSPISLDYIRALIGFPIKTWVLENKFNPNKGKRKVISYSGSDPRKIIAALVKALQNGEKALVHLSGQKQQSTWGTQNLESYLKKKFPDRKILRIDSESVDNPHHPAFNSMANLNSIVGLYDIVICSPVIETGVSIDLYNHFDGVWCLAYGHQTVDVVCQTLERLRDHVIRHIWAKDTAKNHRIGNGSTTVRSLLYSEHQVCKANIKLLQQADFDDFDDFDVNSSRESLTAWANRACVINHSQNTYRQSILNKLQQEGYDVSSFQEEQQKEEEKTFEKQVKEAVKHNKHEDYQTYKQDVSDIPSPTPSQLKSLQQKSVKTKEEQLQLRKGQLIELYGITVTPFLVEKDDKNWYSQLELQYYLTVGHKYLSFRDKRNLEKLTRRSPGKAFKPDVNKVTLSSKIKALEIIEIWQFLDPTARFTSESLEDWFQRILTYRFEIYRLLGVIINPNNNPIKAAQQLLAKFDLKLEYKGRPGKRHNQQRTYGGANLNPDGREAIFAHWLARDEKMYSPQTVSTNL